jgi:site-specific DNA recombinase
LNRRGIPSQGSSWKRVTRRASGWMNSSVRVILKNPLYTGAQRWNVSQFVRDPDTGKTQRRMRAASDWINNQIEELRIVPDDLFQRAQARTKFAKAGDVRLKSGGKPRHMLSGILRCESCGAHYVIADKYSYACSSFLQGRDCSNDVRVNRKSLEGTILGPLMDDLRDPERVARMAREMEEAYAKKLKAQQARMLSAPRELAAIDERVAALRAMPGLDEEERRLLIERAEAKRREIQAAQPAAKQQARVLAMLPKAAKAYLKQLEEGLAGDSRAAAKGRLIVKDMIGPVSLSPGKDGSLWATYKPDMAVLVRTAGTGGRGDRI